MPLCLDCFEDIRPCSIRFHPEFFPSFLGTSGGRHQEPLRSILATVGAFASLGFIQCQTFSFILFQWKRSEKVLGVGVGNPKKHENIGLARKRRECCPHEANRRMGFGKHFRAQISGPTWSLLQWVQLASLTSMASFGYDSDPLHCASNETRCFLGLFNPL